MCPGLPCRACAYEYTVPYYIVVQCNGLLYTVLFPTATAPWPCFSSAQLETHERCDGGRTTRWRMAVRKHKALGAQPIAEQAWSSAVCLSVSPVMGGRGCAMVTMVGMVACCSEGSASECVDPKIEFEKPRSTCNLRRDE